MPSPRGGAGATVPREGWGYAVLQSIRPQTLVYAPPSRPARRRPDLLVGDVRAFFRELSERS
ncbi:epoxide hydrolase [Streptomyces azureus]|uniref:Epoxide hydrolase n=1 Tax=Streptomyces azureus TaxID=146537 RepID=A0A0K8PF60_STRAJ|nr:hypothetical protein [Streptomyces azureus]GAP46515.1 epoxide hydrolase [Streptomyces azureus]